MNCKLTILLAGILVLGISAWLAYSQFQKPNDPQTAVDDERNCNSCANRHNSFLRTRKALKDSKTREKTQEVFKLSIE